MFWYITLHLIYGVGRNLTILALRLHTRLFWWALGEFFSCYKEHSSLSVFVLPTFLFTVRTLYILQFFRCWLSSSVNAALFNGIGRRYSLKTEKKEISASNVCFSSCDTKWLVGYMEHSVLFIGQSWHLLWRFYEIHTIKYSLYGKCRVY